MRRTTSIFSASLDRISVSDWIIWSLSGTAPRAASPARGWYTYSWPSFTSTLEWAG